MPSDPVPPQDPHGESTPRPGPPARATRSRSRDVVALAVVAILLMLGLIWTGAHWADQRTGTQARIATLQADHRVHVQRLRNASTALQAAFTAVNLPGMLSDVRTRTRSYQDYLIAWAKLGQDAQLVGLREMQDLQSDCLAAVVRYDEASARFSDRIRGSQPARVDMTDAAYDCGADRWKP
jgi:hypothetical protein